MKKILVTGSSGTIGTRLCQQLLANGYEVVGVDWKPNKWDSEVQKRTLILDLRDKDSVLKQLPGGVDAVIHLAANARVYNLVVDPSMARDNFETLFNTLEYTRQNKIPRFFFASSREVYGNSPKTTYNEDDAFVKNCESPYTASKIGGEALVHSYGQCYDMDFLIFRFSNVYGMYDESDRVVPLFIKLAAEKKPLTVYGVDKLLDFTYIDDVVDGLLIALDRFDNIKGGTYNLAYGEGTSIVTVAQQIQKAFDSGAEISLQENRTGEVVKYIADIGKIKRELGFTPKVKIDEGVRRSIEWYSKNLLSS